MPSPRASCVSGLTVSVPFDQRRAPQLEPRDRDRRPAKRASREGPAGRYADMLILRMLQGGPAHGLQIAQDRASFRRCAPGGAGAALYKPATSHRLRSHPKPTSAQARKTRSAHTRVHSRRFRGRARVVSPAITIPITRTRKMICISTSGCQVTGNQTSSRLQQLDLVTASG
jgi:hypothetical protein